MSYRLKTEPDSPSKYDITPPWRKRVEIVDLEDDGRVKSEPISTREFEYVRESEYKREFEYARETPRPAFEPMRFLSSAAFTAHLKQVDPLIEQVKIVCRLKKYDSRFDTCQQSCMQLEAELRNYPPALQADAQEQTSQKLVRLRRYILELQNRKYCLLWNEMCERSKSPVGQPETQFESRCENEAEVTDPRLESERYRTQLRQNAGASQPSAPATKIPSTNDCMASEQTKPILAREPNLRVSEPSERPNNEAGKSVSQEPDKCEVATDGRVDANSRPNGSPVTSPAAPESPKRKASADAIPKRKTLGKAIPKRKNLGKAILKRKTLGKVIPKRKTLGNAIPKRKASGDAIPKRTEDDDSKQNVNSCQQFKQNPDSTSGRDLDRAGFNNRPNESAARGADWYNDNHFVLDLSKQKASDEIPKSTVDGGPKLNLGSRMQSKQNHGSRFVSFRTSKRSNEWESDESDQSQSKRSGSCEPRPATPVKPNTESYFQPFHRDTTPIRSFHSYETSNILPTRNGTPPARQFDPWQLIPECLFCDGEHNSHECETFNTLEERETFFEVNHLCTNCGRTEHEYKCDRHYCKWECGSICNHHSALCPRALYPIKRRVPIKERLY